MKTLYFYVPNINQIIGIYNKIEVIRYTGSSYHPATPVGEVNTLVDWVVVTGVYPYNAPINLASNTTEYFIYDDQYGDSDWYASRYVNSTDPTTINSGWSSPVLSTTQGVYYNPIYPQEISLSSEDRVVVERIRTLIGDPIDLKRDSGLEGLGSIHVDGYVYEMSEKGWPASIKVCGVQHNNTTDPIVNGYKYLKFRDPIDIDSCEHLPVVDIWYYTFRHSNKEIISTYDITPPPFGLTEVTATSDTYLLAAAIDLIRSELLLDATESGAKITDDLTTYDPSPGLEARRKILEDLEDQLDKVVTSLKMSGITGVRID